MNYFETDSLALAPYLYLEGLKYVGYKISQEGKRRVILKFEDPKNIGNDLALEFTKSRDCQYKKTWSFFRNEVEDCLKKGV